MQNDGYFQVIGMTYAEFMTPTKEFNAEAVVAVPCVAI